MTTKSTLSLLEDQRTKLILEIEDHPAYRALKIIDDAIVKLKALEQPGVSKYYDTHHQNIEKNKTPEKIEKEATEDTSLEASISNEVMSAYYANTKK